MRFLHDRSGEVTRQIVRTHTRPVCYSVANTQKPNPSVVYTTVGPAPLGLPTVTPWLQWNGFSDYMAASVSFALPFGTYEFYVEIDNNGVITQYMIEDTPFYFDVYPGALVRFALYNYDLNSITVSNIELETTRIASSVPGEKLISPVFSMTASPL